MASVPQTQTPAVPPEKAGNIAKMSEAWLR